MIRCVVYRPTYDIILFSALSTGKFKEFPLLKKDKKGQISTGDEA